MSHNCKALVLRCMDFRIKLSDFAKRLEKSGYPEGTYDLVSMAGSGKDCLSCLPGESEFLLKQIGLSSKLHCISEVVIIYHDNCGAYSIADPKKEHETQVGDLEKITSLINSRFPVLKVKTYIIKGTTSGQLNLEETN